MKKQKLPFDLDLASLEEQLAEKVRKQAKDRADLETKVAAAREKKKEGLRKDRENLNYDIEKNALFLLTSIPEHSIACDSSDENLGGDFETGHCTRCMLLYLSRNEGSYLYLLKDFRLDIKFMYDPIK